jgi:hypothetical protein
MLYKELRRLPAKIDKTFDAGYEPISVVRTRASACASANQPVIDLDPGICQSDMV